MRILAIKWRGLGDTILWTAALQALREQYPEAEIDLAFPRAYAELFEGDGRFGKVFGLENSLAKSAQVIRGIRQRRYDMVANFHASQKSLILAAMAGAREKVIHHHSRKARRFFSDRPIPNLGRVMAAHERDLNLVRALGWQGDPPLPGICSVPEWKTEAEERLAKLSADPSRALILFNTETSRAAKRWSPNNFVQMALALAERATVGMIFQSRAALDPYIERQVGEKILLLHTPHLRDAMGYLSCASLYIGSDSGIKHLAAALGVKTLTLFGPESLGEWHFYPAPDHRAIQKPVLCRNNDPQPEGFAWCGEAICPYGSHACMSLITPKEVIEHANQMLG